MLLGIGSAHRWLFVFSDLIKKELLGFFKLVVGETTGSNNNSLLIEILLKLLTFMKNSIILVSQQHFRTVHVLQLYSAK